jgi:hypothetical protein
MSNDDYDDAEFAAEMAVVEALADKAMAGWNERLSPADRVRVRDVLVEALATHPNAIGLVAQLAASPNVNASGEVGEKVTPADANTARRGGSGAT